MTTQLFDADALGGYLRKPVTADAATAVERVVWGWLKPVLGLEGRPDPVPDEVFSWAIELGAIVYENPAGLSGQASGPFSVQFSSERKAEILTEAAGTDGTAKPTGNFPPAPCWPDPIDRY
jgi:hypothetical protein